MSSLISLKILVFAITIAVTTAAEDQISIFPSAEKENLNLNVTTSGIIPRQGVDKSLYIRLPFIPTRPCAGNDTTPTPIIDCAANVNLTSSCQCGLAICEIGQYCNANATASVCSTPGECAQNAVVQTPCHCTIRNNICNPGDICSGNECIRAQCPNDNLTPATVRCVCGTSDCAVGDICTLATSLCTRGTPMPPLCMDPSSNDNPFYVTAPCNCGNGDGSMVCRAGQRCLDPAGATPSTCLPNVCGTGNVGAECLCGSQVCVAGQTCQGLACNPPRCLVLDNVPVQTPCICGAMMCTVGMICNYGWPGGPQCRPYDSPSPVG